MKRQIITALSITLLISSPISLIAGKHKKKNQKPTISSASSSANDLASLAIVTAAALNAAPATQVESSALQATNEELSYTTPIIMTSSRTLPKNAVTKFHEFDPKETQAQRAALFVAIATLGANNGLKNVKTKHDENRQQVLLSLWAAEDLHTGIITATARHNNEPLEQHDDFDKVSVSSSNGKSLEMPEEQTTDNNNNTIPSVPTTTPTNQPTSTPTPSSQPGLFWRMLGYK